MTPLNSQLYELLVDKTLKFGATVETDIGY